jgi:hypothetical protein
MTEPALQWQARGYDPRIAKSQRSPNDDPKGEVAYQRAFEEVAGKKPPRVPNPVSYPHSPSAQAYIKRRDKTIFSARNERHEPASPPPETQPTTPTSSYTPLDPQNRYSLLRDRDEPQFSRKPSIEDVKRDSDTDPSPIYTSSYPYPPTTLIPAEEPRLFAGVLGSIQPEFEKVIEDFKDKLKDDKLYGEILKTTSIDQLYDATDAIQREQAGRGQLRNLARIQPFVERLRDFSSMIEVLTQAQPNILALIWGPVKLLIQWTSSLKESFDAFITIAAEIGELLPRFTEFEEVISRNEHSRSILDLFFRDILDFYLVALKFFSKPSKLLSS